MSTTDKEQHSSKIVGISGSLRAGSYTTLAVALALKGAQELKCETKLINLRDYQLVFCDGKDDESQFPKDVFRLRDEVKQAQGIILGTPEYHGGYSGVLKNALDLMGFEEFEGKMLGLVGVSGGAMGAFGAMNSLREVGRALHRSHDRIHPVPQLGHARARPRKNGEHEKVDRLAGFTARPRP